MAFAGYKLYDGKSPSIVGTATPITGQVASGASSTPGASPTQDPATATGTKATQSAAKSPTASAGSKTTATSTPTNPAASPTPTPKPRSTPMNIPANLAECYQPRPPAAGQPAPELRPANAGSIFQNCQIVSFYGFPNEPNMGILGTAGPEQIVQQLRTQAAAYDQINGPRHVIPALHLIYAVAQDTDHGDGTYLLRMPDSLVQQYIDLAEKDNLLVFLDIQMGHSNVSTEFQYVKGFLRNPRVHLALDPEFKTPDNAVPGTVIGSMDASAINQAQQALQQIVDQNHLPNKILMVHQFQPGMIANKDKLASFPGVDLVIDMDGFGDPQVKTSEYQQFIGTDNAPHGAFKLFYKQDHPVMTPQQVEALKPQPDIIIYQ